MAGIAISSSSSSSISFKRTSEEAEIISREAIEASPKRVELVDWDTLSTLILLELEDVKNESDENFSSLDIATSIASTNPSIMTLLCSYPFSEVRSSLCIRSCENRENAVALQLYAMSLENGRFGNITISLEENIVNYINQSTKEALQTIVNTAANLVSQPHKTTLAEIEYQKSNLSKISSKIGEALNLFCYIDKHYQKPISILIAQAKYPTCKKYFAQLQQNLQTSLYERDQLQIVNREVLTQLAQLTALAKPLYEAIPSKQLPRDKEIFFLGNYELFWNVGVKIIGDAFIETFKLARNSQFRLPKELKDALIAATRLELKWNGYQLAYLLKNADTISEKAFISNVWTKFSDNDPEDLMRKYLFTLPNDKFETLKTQIKNSENPMQMMESTFLKELRTKLTFLTLNTWCENNKVP